ncbi:MAG: hypothetical protein ACQEP8_06440 [Chlamydiota bacterium]
MDNISALITPKTIVYGATALSGAVAIGASVGKALQIFKVDKIVYYNDPRNLDRVV